MKIQTQRKRDSPIDKIERDKFSSKVDEREVGNVNGIKSAVNLRKNTVEEATASPGIKSVRTLPKTATQGSGSISLPTRHRKIPKNIKAAQRQKYSIAKTDSDGSVAIEMAQTVQAAGSAAVQVGGVIRTAVKKTANGIGSIKTFVKHGVNVGSMKDAGRIATAVNSGVVNAAKGVGDSLLKIEIDKSKITDTGTETIKQGLTELRHVNNARKAVSNAAKGISKLRCQPRKLKHINKRVIKRNQKKAAKLAAQNMRKLICSKAGIILLGIVSAVILLVVIVNGVLTLIISVVNSLFSWLAPPADEPDKTELEKLQGYQTHVVEYIDEKQAEIDEIVDGFVCDKKSYSPYEEISELNQFGNKEIEIENRNEILAILAVKKYRAANGDLEDMELDFTEEEISETVDKFYEFEYSYTYGHCTAEDCKKREASADSDDESGESETEYYCDEDHEWLHGEVTNCTLDEVLNSYDFNDEEKDLYQMYLEQITEILGGG